MRVTLVGGRDVVDGAVGASRERRGVGGQGDRGRRAARQGPDPGVDAEGEGQVLLVEDGDRDHPVPPAGGVNEGRPLSGPPRPPDLDAEGVHHQGERRAAGAGRPGPVSQRSTPSVARPGLARSWRAPQGRSILRQSSLVFSWWHPRHMPPLVLRQEGAQLGSAAQQAGYPYGDPVVDLQDLACTTLGFT